MIEKNGYARAIEEAWSEFNEAIRSAAQVKIAMMNKAFADYQRAESAAKTIREGAISAAMWAAWGSDHGDDTYGYEDYE